MVYKPRRMPIKDHRGNGKLERLIRTINGRLRTNKKIIMSTKDKTGLSEILFALRMNLSATKKSPYERYTEQEPKTTKRILTNKNRFFQNSMSSNYLETILNLAKTQ